MTNDQTTYRAMLRTRIAELRIVARLAAHGLQAVAMLLTAPVAVPVLAALDLRRFRRAQGLDAHAVDNALTLAASGALLLLWGGSLILWGAQ
jgi:hypothetical protein